MAVPNSLFDQITAITNDVFLPTMPELVFDQNVVFSMLHKGGTKLQSGAAIRQPVIYQFSQDGAYFDFEQGSTAAEDQVTAAVFNWKLYRQRVVISEPELLRNEGPEGIFRLLKAKMEGAATAIREAIAVDFYTDANGDAVRGVNSIYNLLGDGSAPSSPTISGGIDKSTNTFWRGTNFDFSTAILGSRAEMLEFWSALEDGAIHPNLIVSHPSAQRNHHFEIGEGGAPGQGERFVNTDQMKSGFTAFTFQGQPWVTDRHILTAGANVTDAGAGRLLALNTKFIDFVSHSKRNFTMRKFMQPVDQDVNIAWLYWMGNATVSDPRRSGFMYS